MLPLDQPVSGALGLLFALMGHAVDWPVVEGGSGNLARALLGVLRDLGGQLLTGRRVRSLDDLPPARVYLFDTSPAQLANVCAPILPASYVARLRRYRYGPGSFKVDWALSEPIPLEGPAGRARLDGAPRRHARGDRRERTRHVGRPAYGKPLHDRGAGLGP